MAIRIISDATAGLPKAYCSVNDIGVAPLSIETPTGRIEETYIEDIRTSKELSGAKTSQGQLHVFVKLFEETVTKGDQAICFTISSGMSGTYSTACLAASMVDEKNIRVIDTLNGVGGHRIMVENALRRAQSGLPLNYLEAAAKWEASHCQALFCTGDIYALKRSGRVGAAAAVLGSVMQIHPVLKLDEEGKMVILEKVRGEARAIGAMISRLGDAVGRLAVCYTEAENVARVMAEKVAAVRENLKIELMRCGAVITCHLGTSALGLVLIPDYEYAHREFALV